MKSVAIAIGCGVLFGAGLVVSDMINPARVLAFLDVAGEWDPSLALVMGGALILSSLAYLVRRRMRAPLAVTKFEVPAGTSIDRRLVIGAALFGVGWGLVGLCPGPAIAALASAQWPVVVFVAAMIGGFGIFRLLHESGAAR